MKRNFLFALIVLLLLLPYPSHQQTRVIGQCGPPGTGRSRSIAGTNPAAGAEISETVPTGTRWHISAVRISLVTDGTAANRTFQLVFDDGASPSFADIITQTAQTAGTTRVYFFTLDLPVMELAVVGNLLYPLPSELWLPEGFRMRTVTTNLQAGDDYGAPEFLVEECTP